MMIETANSLFVHGLHQLHGWGKPRLMGSRKIEEIENGTALLITPNSLLVTRERLSQIDEIDEIEQRTASSITHYTLHIVHY